MTRLYGVYEFAKSSSQFLNKSLLLLPYQRMIADCKKTFGGKQMNKKKLVKIGGILIVLLALAALVGSSLTFAQDDEPDTDDPVTTPEDGTETEGSTDTEAVTPGYGRFNHHGMGGRGLIDREAARALLAEELGVTLDELEAARDAAIAAVSAEDGRPDRDEVRALMAEALGVTVEELEAAQDTVQETMLAQLVEDGVITQEQLDEMLEMQALHELSRDIFSRDDAKAVIAEQLGLTVEELAAARDEGTTVSELADAQGIDMETLMTAVSEARTAAFAQAVADGTLTQEQADLLLSQRGPHFGFGGHGGPGGGGMHGGHGGHGGMRGGGFGPGSSNGSNNSDTSTSSDLDA
jgi:ABC-type Fe2+-enterobactin transport system substrate-binding protein